MKRVSFVLLALVVCAAAQAQVRFGARAGLNISSITGKDVDGYSAKAGIFFGGLAQLPVTSKFLVQPEALISMQGAKWEDYDGSTRSTYLQIPVMAKYHFTEGFFAETGPQLGFLISAKDNDEGEHEDIMEYVKKTDFSWAIGAGYHFTKNIAVTIRYNASLTKWYETEKNSVFQLGVFYLFPTRSK